MSHLIRVLILLQTHLLRALVYSRYKRRDPKTLRQHCYVLSLPNEEQNTEQTSKNRNEIKSSSIMTNRSAATIGYLLAVMANNKYMRTTHI